jgi:phage baseplate assembly protein W
MKTQDIIGKGLILPLERHGSDFDNVSGAGVIESSIKQILRTRKGELRWNPDFGLPNMLHESINDAVLAQVQADTAESITKFEPRAELLDIVILQGGHGSGFPDNSIVVSVTWRAVIRGKRGNTVLTDERSTEVVI